MRSSEVWLDLITLFTLSPNFIPVYNGDWINAPAVPELMLLKLLSGPL